MFERNYEISTPSFVASYKEAEENCWRGKMCKTEKCSYRYTTRWYWGMVQIPFYFSILSNSICALHFAPFLRLRNRNEKTFIMQKKKNLSKIDLSCVSLNYNWILMETIIKRAHNHIMIKWFFFSMVYIKLIHFFLFDNYFYFFIWLR